jgi:hypothetical protein
MVVKADEYTVTDLLNICQRSHVGFTLGEIVERVLVERPGDIPDFAEAWGEIHRRGLVRIRRYGRPTTYELVMDAASDSKEHDRPGCTLGA